MTTPRSTRFSRVTISLMRNWIRNLMAWAILFVCSVTGVFGADRSETSSAPKPMSQDELIMFAMSAAPAHIAKDAAVMLLGEDGQLIEVKKGTNGFMCMPMADPNVPT